MCCFTSCSLARIFFPSFFLELNFHFMRNWEVRLHQASGRAEVTFCSVLLPLGYPDVLCGWGVCCTVSCCGLWLFSLLICLVANNLQWDRNVTKWDVLYKLSLTSWSVLWGQACNCCFMAKSRQQVLGLFSCVQLQVCIGVCPICLCSVIWRLGCFLVKMKDCSQMFCDSVDICGVSSESRYYILYGGWA